MRGSGLTAQWGCNENADDPAGWVARRGVVAAPR